MKSLNYYDNRYELIFHSFIKIAILFFSSSEVRRWCRCISLFEITDKMFWMNRLSGEDRIRGYHDRDKDGLVFCGERRMEINCSLLLANGSVFFFIYIPKPLFLSVPSISGKILILSKLPLMANPSKLGSSNVLEAKCKRQMRIFDLGFKPYE